VKTLDRFTALVYKTDHVFHTSSRNCVVHRSLENVLGFFISEDK